MTIFAKFLIFMMVVLAVSSVAVFCFKPGNMEEYRERKELLIMTPVLLIIGLVLLFIHTHDL